MTRSPIEKARKQFEQARARLQAAEARERQAERKRDTRRKIIIGAALIDLASRDAAALNMVERLVANLPRERDRQSFEGWQPSPSGSSASTVQEEDGGGS